MRLKGNHGQSIWSVHRCWTSLFPLTALSTFQGSTSIFYIWRPLCLFVCLFYFLFVFCSPVNILSTHSNSHFKLLMIRAYSDILEISFNTLLGWIQYRFWWVSLLFYWIISAGNALRKGVSMINFLSSYMLEKVYSTMRFN